MAKALSGRCMACFVLGVEGIDSVQSFARFDHMPGAAGAGCSPKVDACACALCCGTKHKRKDCLVVLGPWKKGWQKPKKGSCMGCGLSYSHGSGKEGEGCAIGSTPPVWKACWAFLRLAPKSLRRSICTLMQHREEDFHTAVGSVGYTGSDEASMRRYYEWLTKQWSEAHSMTCGAVLFLVCYYEVRGVEKPIELTRVLKLTHRLQD